jgi:predicted SnoaL-like aldol condensation-catalyzing enzyme
MHLVWAVLFITLQLASAVSPQRSVRLPCSTADITEGNYGEACSQKRYCPGREVDEKIQEEIFAGFLETLYGEKNVSKAFETYVDLNIIEHDPDNTQDRDAIVARLSQIIPLANLTILVSSFNNKIGLAYIRVDEDPQPAALADIYRMEGTCIVEHWDVMQFRPENSTNPIAMF